MKKIQIKIVNPMLGRDFPMPEYATEGSAGIDLKACLDEPLTIESGETKLIGSGMAVDIQDRSLMAVLVSRSGLGVKKGINVAQGAGIIDSDYHGQVFVGLWNRSSEPYIVNPGERVCQMLFVPVVQAELEVVDGFVSDTERGSGGFGSTGKH